MSVNEPSLMSRLDESVQELVEEVLAEEILAIRRYQATDRTYELVSDVLRRKIAYDDLDQEDADVVARIVTTLDLLTTRWRTPEPLVLYRGQRSVQRTFGEPPQVGQDFELDSFVSTSIHREVAVEEFTQPPGPGGPVLLEIATPAHTSGLWVPPIGVPSLAYQGELILPRLTRMRIDAIDATTGILTVNCEVLQ